MSERSKVQINYKSGISMVVEVDDFTLTHKPRGVSIEWEGAVPRPMLLGIDDIESVWELPDVGGDE